MFIVFQRKELWSSLGMNSLYATFFNHLSTFNHKLLLGYYCRFGQFVFGKLSYLLSILDEMLNSWGLEVWYLTMSKITCFERLATRTATTTSTTTVSTATTRTTTSTSTTTTATLLQQQVNFNEACWAVITSVNKNFFDARFLCFLEPQFKT